MTLTDTKRFIKSFGIDIDAELKELGKTLESHSENGRIRENLGRLLCLHAIRKIGDKAKAMQKADDE